MARKLLNKPGLTVTYTANGALVAYSFAKLDSDDAKCTKCGAGEKPVGLTPTAVDDGKPVGLITDGIGLVAAAGTIAAGDEVASDADGLAVVAAEGDYVAGIAVTAAAAAGGVVSVRLLPPAVAYRKAGAVVVLAGTVALVAGAATVSTAKILDTDVVLVSRQVTGGTVGHLTVGTVTEGVSFAIASTSNTDTSTVAYVVLR